MSDLVTVYLTGNKRKCYKNKNMINLSFGKNYEYEPNGSIKIIISTGSRVQEHLKLCQNLNLGQVATDEGSLPSQLFKSTNLDILRKIKRQRFPLWL